MIKTEKKHWSNGYAKRGFDFKTYCMSIFNIGIMFIWGKVNTGKIKRIKPYIKIYKLI